MGHRTGFTVTKIEPAPTLPSPNAVVPQITVEIRAHWPGHMGNEPAVLEQLELAYQKAAQRIRFEAEESPPTPTHRHSGRFCLDCETDRSRCSHPRASV